VNDQHTDNSPDRILVNKVLSGNTDAFAIIIKNTEGLVAQVVYKMIPNNEDRKDIAQDVYLKAFHQLQQFRFQSKLSTWIARIAYNTCLNYLEKKRLFFPPYAPAAGEDAEDPLEVLSNQQLDNLTSETEKLFSQKELAAILQAAIEQLPPLYRLLIILFHNQELSYIEIAQITQLPGGTIKSYLSRARKTLRDNLLLTYKKEAL